MNALTLELARKAGLKKHPSEDREYIGNFDWREFAVLVAEHCAKISETAEPYSAADLIRKEFGCFKED